MTHHDIRLIEIGEQKGYAKAVREIVAWLRMNAMSGHTLAAQIKAKFGGRDE